MNRPVKLPHSRLNLLLIDLPKAAIPNEQQKELAMALMDLLIQAAQERDAGEGNGGGDEREADC